MKNVLFAILMLLPMAASAFTGVVEIDGIMYDVSTKMQTAKAIGPSSKDITGQLVIPGTIIYDSKTCVVSSVAGFDSCMAVTSLVLEEGVSDIGNNAFKDCVNLGEIDFPLSLRNIRGTAFEGTPWYERQADGVVYAGKVAYRFKGDLPDNYDMVIKEGTISISERAFSIVRDIKSLTLPTSLRYIGDRAFMGSKITNLIIPDGVEVENRAFASCPNLKSIKLGNVSFLGADYDGKGYWFDSCNSLETIELHCKEIGKWFAEMPSIINVILGDEVEIIDDEAFFKCTGIKEIELPNSIKYLSGFDVCTGLTSISIPSSVIELGSYAFSGCTGITSLTLNDGLKKIGNYAFARCTGLTNLVIPNSVESIGTSHLYGDGRSFMECTNLSSVSLPDNIRELGEGTFGLCSGLTKVSLPKGLTTINPALFINCAKLNTITIPASVKRIYGGAFSECKELEDVYCYSTTVPEIVQATNYGNDPFYGSDIQYTILHVPAQAIESYKADNYWKKFKDIVPIPDYEVEKCATPTISYSNGRLVLDCETEGAECFATITDTDIKSYEGKEISLSATYIISAHAKASGYADSDVVTATLTWGDAGLKVENITVDSTSSNKCDVNADGAVDVADIATIINEMAARSRKEK